MKDILVTGSEGFLGKAIRRGLVYRGYNVAGFDKKKGHNVVDRLAVEKALHGKAAVVHLGSPCSALMFAESPKEAWFETIRGMANILKYSSGRVIFASTCTLYGDSPRPVSEEHELPAPPNLYAAAKLECERLSLLSTIAGKDIKILRIFAGYGPEEWTKGKYASPVMHFIRALIERKKPIIYGAGTQVRDFIFIDDIVEFTIRALETSSNEKLFNIGSATGTSFLNLVELIQEKLDFKAAARFVRPPEGYVPSIVANTCVATRELGYSARVGIEEGLEITIDKFIHKRTRSPCRASMKPDMSKEKQ